MRSAADILALISKTESEISRVKSEMASSQEHIDKVSSPTMDASASGSAILTASWLTRQYSQGKSMSDMNKVIFSMSHSRN